MSKGMGPRPSGARVAVGFAALLVALLGVLATLQYRWAGQVSDSERERMRSTLRARAAQFAQDFDRELTRAVLIFQNRPDEIIANPGAALTERHRQWTATAAFPQLVGDLFLYEQLPGKPATLARLDRDAAVLRPVEWPAALAPLREFFATRASETSPRLPLWPELVDDRVPALFLPLLDVKVTTRGDGELRRIQALDSNQTCRLVAVMLDRRAIEQTILPALAARYFGGESGFDYHVGVVDRGVPPRVVFASDSWNAAETSRADLSTGIMDVRFDEVPALAGLAPPAVLNALPTATHVNQFAVTIVRRGKTGDGKPLKAGEGSRWQLVLRHRAGSLEAAVQRSRTRNLLVSFGVLVLLALAATMVLVSTERARRLAAQQIEFVAGVSHELRTPVSVICSAAENLADGVIDDGQQVRRYGNLIRDEGRRLADMLERVLELAGVWSGRSAAYRVPTDAAAVVDAAVSGMRAELEEAGVRVERTFASDLPQVVGDPVALRAVIQNLIANAVKYRGDGRSIRIDASASRAGSGRPMVEVTVTDTGVGIDPRDLPHIFDPFYRGRAAAGQARGTGVGLTVVKRIVEAHGGTVSVTSEPGRGSTFTIRIPAHDVPAHPELVEARTTNL